MLNKTYIASIALEVNLLLSLKVQEAVTVKRILLLLFFHAKKKRRKFDDACFLNCLKLNLNNQ